MAIDRFTPITIKTDKNVRNDAVVPSIRGPPRETRTAAVTKTNMR
jgi:hypothetical protein